MASWGPRLVAGVAHSALEPGQGLFTASPASVTRADSVARFTVASDTPGCFLSTRSTRETHEAQVMPPIPRSITESIGVSIRPHIMARSSSVL
jgi:hypothetical protein